MPIRPIDKGTSSGAGGAASSQYMYNFYSDLIELNNTVGSYGVLTTTSFSAGTSSALIETGYDGQFTFTSTTTAISGGSLRIGNVNITPKTGDVTRFWFKTPATIDASSVVNFGFADSFLSSPQNFIGMQLSGNSCRGLIITAGVSTQANNPITLDPSVRYCAEVKYTSDTQVTIKIYNSTTGSELNSSSFTVTVTRRVPIMVAVNTGTVAKDIIIADAIDLRLVKRGTKLPE
jgi:hypothetical protein